MRILCGQDVHHVCSEPLAKESQEALPTFFSAILPRLQLSEVMCVGSRWEPDRSLSLGEALQGSACGGGP